jgi:hypothetical protein
VASADRDSSGSWSSLNDDHQNPSLLPFPVPDYRSMIGYERIPACLLRVSVSFLARGAGALRREAGGVVELLLIARVEILVVRVGLAVLRRPSVVSGVGKLLAVPVKGSLVVSLAGTNLLHLQLVGWLSGRRQRGSVLVPFGPALSWVALAAPRALFVVVLGRGPVVLNCPWAGSGVP